MKTSKAKHPKKKKKNKNKQKPPQTIQDTQLINVNYPGAETPVSGVSHASFLDQSPSFSFHKSFSTIFNILMSRAHPQQQAAPLKCRA